MIPSKTIRLLGAHVSASGGAHNAVDNGEAIGCAAIQIFTKNQRQWFAPPLSQREVDLFRVKRAESGIKSIVAHGSYLINLCSAHEKIMIASVNSLVEEFRRSESLGLLGVVFHPGSHGGQGESKGIHLIIEGINRLIEKTPEFKSKIILETTSGAGSHLGSTFEQLARIMDGVTEPARMGVCVDTCHIFSAGYELRTPKAYEETVGKLKSVIGLDKILVFHVNDSKFEFGSRKDRHEFIGKGRIGKKAFGFLVNDPRFVRVPMILEIPGEDAEFKRDLKLLRSLIK